MIDLSDWVWVLVVVIWIAVRVLPRLFRFQGGESAPPPRPQRSESGEPLSSDGSRAAKPPAPIEPR